MRKLATIRKISNIRPIEGADAIEVAIIDGWQVVIKKNEFKKGDTVIYFEIDSWIPQQIAPFLTKTGHSPNSYNGILGERLRTIKLLGQISQGLILPISPLCDGLHIEEGDDVTRKLGIVKWEPISEDASINEPKGKFPIKIPKTDQERIQNIWKKFKERNLLNAYTDYDITEKLDGTSMTAYLMKDENGEMQFGVCSRNLEMKDIEGNAYWKAAKDNALEYKLRFYGRELAIQGELIGPGIQGNKYNMRNRLLYVFDIYDITNAIYLSKKEKYDIIEKMDLTSVPQIQPDYLKNEPTLENFLKFAERKSQLANIEAEGIVVKTGGIAFKVISNKFLLKQR